MTCRARWARLVMRNSICLGVPTVSDPKSYSEGSIRSGGSDAAKGRSARYAPTPSRTTAANPNSRVSHLYMASLPSSGGLTPPAPAELETERCDQADGGRGQDPDVGRGRLLPDHARWLWKAKRTQPPTGE